MASINLLPWREALREQRKQQFVASLVVTALLAASIVWIMGLRISSAISTQQSRNQYLQREINALDQSIAEIKTLTDKKAKLLERMTLIQGLQGNRPVIVRIFDQLVRVVPAGVYLKNLDMKGTRFSLVGIAESNSQVSALMRSIDTSPWFTDPNLTAVRKVAEAGERLNEFDLTFVQTNPEHSAAPAISKEQP